MDQSLIFVRHIAARCMNAETTRSNPETQSDKWSRHGWGDVTLLKEEGYAGIPHPRGVEVHRGKAVPPALIAKDGRADLFGTLQYTEVSAVQAASEKECLVCPKKAAGVQVKLSCVCR